MQEVVPRIYIGDYASSQSVAELQRNKVRHVISASASSRLDSTRREGVRADTCAK